MRYDAVTPSLVTDQRTTQDLLVLRFSPGKFLQPWDLYLAFKWIVVVNREFEIVVVRRDRGS